MNVSTSTEKKIANSPGPANDNYSNISSFNVNNKFVSNVTSVDIYTLLSNKGDAKIYIFFTTINISCVARLTCWRDICWNWALCIHTFLLFFHTKKLLVSRAINMFIRCPGDERGQQPLKPPSEAARARLTQH